MEFPTWRNPNVMDDIKFLKIRLKNSSNNDLRIGGLFHEL